MIKLIILHLNLKYNQMSVQLYSHTKADLEKAVEIILKKATDFTLPVKPKSRS